MSPKFPLKIQWAVLKSLSRPIQENSTGLSPSKVSLSRKVWKSFSEFLRQVLQHHISLYFHIKIQFALFCFFSLILTESRLISFPLGTKMFQFPKLPFLSEWLMSSSLIQGSLVQWLLAPRQSISQLAAPFISISSQVIHLMGLVGLYFAYAQHQWKWCP